MNIIKDGALEPLSKAEQDNLWVKYKKGDQEAKDILVRSHLKMVESIAINMLKDSKTDKDKEDLFQSGCIGILEALENYDMEKNTKFTTIAYYYIFKRMWETYIEMDRAIVLPQGMIMKMTKVIQAEEDYLSSHGKVASTKQVAKMTGLTENKVKKLKSYIQLPHSISVSPGDEENQDIDILDPATAVETDVITSFAEEQLGLILDSLRDRERDMLIKKFGLFGTKSMPIAQIATHHDLSTQRVTSIINQTIRKLKPQLEKLGYSYNDFL